jgi:hypothetical protein
MDSASRPSFARGFPRRPELDALVEAFSRGDYARVRAEAPRLAQQSGDDDVKRAAETLVERTRPDPTAVRLLVLAAALLVLLGAWWIVNGHPPAQAPVAPPVEHVR